MGKYLNPRFNGCSYFIKYMVEDKVSRVQNENSF